MGHAFVKGHCLFVSLFKPLYLLSQMMQVVTINERSMRSKAIRFDSFFNPLTKFGSILNYVQFYFLSEGMHF